MVTENCVIVKKANIARGVYDIELSCPQIAGKALPGQFVMVKCEGFTLRRPISICAICKKHGKLRLVFEIRGQGTDWMAGLNVGNALNLLGPLGNGFKINDVTKPAVFVGGGIGVPPLLAAAMPFSNKTTAILGFRSAQNIILADDFRAAGAKTVVCTDDGTAGIHGTVVEPLKNCISENTVSVVFACGPRPMLAAVAKIARENNIQCFVSMEERMACGVGACLGCAIKVKAEDGGEKYLHVCKDGPVFDAEMIVWQPTVK